MVARQDRCLDGVVAKRLDLPYLPGVRATLKVKSLRTADCVVGGFRYDTRRRLVGSLLLGLYDEKGLLHHVGFTASIAAADKPSLTKRLEKLIAPPGFSGVQPGAPSRWSSERSSAWEPLRPSLVAEVRYDHVSGDRFRHGTVHAVAPGQVASAVYAGAAVASDASRLGALGSTCSEPELTHSFARSREERTRGAPRPDQAVAQHLPIWLLERARLGGLRWNASIVAGGDRANVPPAAHWRLIYGLAGAGVTA